MNVSMHTYYQPWLLPFLGWKKHRLPPEVKRYYYHSFEDGLWDLLQKRGIPKDAIFLIPDFYCVDVLNNIETHGYRYVLYPLDQHFQISKKKFLEYIQRHTPQVIMIFHVAGIQSQRMDDPSWIPTLPKTTLVIEDAVHQLINPETITLYSDNHYLMDSPRKVSPIPGSNLYGAKKGMSFPQATTPILTQYWLSAFFYYRFFRICLILSELFSIGKLAVWAHEVLLKKHDDIIGDSPIAHRGLAWYTALFDHIDFQKVTQHKHKQILRYRKLLHPLYATPYFYEIAIPEKEFGNLHVYPIGFSKRPDDILIQKLHTEGVIVWFKFPDAPWSGDKGVLFLPLGFHVKNTDITTISAKLQALAYTLYSHENTRHRR